MFIVSQGKGFQMTFANKCTVSVQFGMGNYCDHYQLCADGDFAELQRKLGAQGSTTAEVAGWKPDGSWVHPEDWTDDVKGYLTADEVLEFMNWVASQ